MHATSERPPNFLYEVVGLTLALLVFCLMLASFDVLRRADLIFLDVASRFVHREAPRKVLVIAIDDRTLEELGGWPLSRATHARLINRLTDSGVAAIGLNLSTTRTANGIEVDDDALRAALKRNGHVVVRADGNGTNDFVDTRSGVTAGHSDVHRDEDGIVRGALMWSGERSHMAVQLLRAAGFEPPACDPVTQGITSSSDHCLRYVPLGARRSHDTLSYVDVLRGRVPENTLRGRIVVLGSTVDGIEARLATPVIDGAWLYAVEQLAETVNAAATSTLITSASMTTRIIFNSAVMPLICLGLILLGPRASLFACANLMILLVACAYAALSVWHVFVPPSAGVLTCALAYPLWGWLRQEALLRYLSLEGTRVMLEPSLPEDRRIGSNFLDPVQRRLSAMTALIAGVRRYREFVSEWVDSLPEATLVTDLDGTIIVANARVTALCAESATCPLSAPEPAGRAVADVLFEMTGSHRAVEFAQRALSCLRAWSPDDALSQQCESLYAQGIEISDARGPRSLFIKCAPIPPSMTKDDARNGALILHVADVTSIRVAERQRDITLRFLSHDMRSPQAAILALVEQMRQIPPRLTTTQFTDLVEQYARTALHLSDDFLFLARAESVPPRLTEVDLALVLGDAVDDLWPQASAMSTSIELTAEPGHIAIADVQLLRRALGNLISNAIKYGPDGAIVRVELTQTAREHRIAVIDRGIGISPQEIRHLFRAFTQLDSRPTRGGHGLGLAFVNTVAESLGGRILIQSAAGHGSIFTLILPLPGMPKEAEDVAGSKQEELYAHTDR